MTKRLMVVGCLAAGAATFSVWTAIGFGQSSTKEPSTDGGAPILHAAAVETTEPTNEAGDTPIELLQRAAQVSPRILAASLGPAPNDYRVNGYDGVWVFLTVDAASPVGADPIRPVWDALLAIGAFRDEMEARGLTPPEGYGLSIQRSDGSTEHYLAWPFGDIAYRQSFTDPEANALVAATIKERATEAGLGATTVETLSPRDLAVAVVTTASDPSKLDSPDAVGSLLDAVVGKQTLFEAVYFEIDDSRGEPLFVLGRNLRTGDGLSFVSPALGFAPERGVPPPRSDGSVESPGG